MNEIKIADFIKKYMDEMGDIGYKEFVNLSKEYETAIDHYKQVQYPAQTRSLHLLNKLYGTRKTLNYEAGLSAIQNQFKEKALEVAVDKGYKIFDDKLTETQKEFDEKINSQKIKEKESDQKKTLNKFDFENLIKQLKSKDKKEKDVDINLD